MSKVKILTITTSGLKKKEGISTVILDNYTLFDKEKFQLDIIASGDYSYQLITEFQNIGVNIKCLPSRKISVIKYINALMQLIKIENYDAVYLHGSSAIMSIELVLAKFCGCKKRIVHSHNTTCKHKTADKLLRPIFYKSYTVALACGNDAGKWLYRKRPFDIIKNGRNTKVYCFNRNKRNEMRKHLGLSNNTLAIGHVGNFNRQKNQMFLLDILERIIKEKKQVKLYLIGDGSTKDDIIREAEHRELSRFICFTGSVSNVPDMLQAMDLMLLPSLHEGLPLVVVEWQIAGLPCILSNLVTHECAFTDLVSFLPIDNAERWCNSILNGEHLQLDREQASKKAIIAAQKSGYDLKENADRLQSYFV